MPSAAVRNSGPAKEIYTTSNGAPHSEPYEAQRVAGHNKPVGGPLLLQDL